MTTDSDGCHVGYLYDNQQCDGWHVDNSSKKSYIISHYQKWFPRKLNLILSTLQSNKFGQYYIL